MQGIFAVHPKRVKPINQNPRTHQSVQVHSSISHSGSVPLPLRDLSHRPTSTTQLRRIHSPKSTRAFALPARSSLGTMFLNNLDNIILRLTHPFFDHDRLLPHSAPSPLPPWYLDLNNLAGGPRRPTPTAPPCRNNLLLNDPAAEPSTEAQDGIYEKQTQEESQQAAENDADNGARRWPRIETSVGSRDG